MILEKMQRWLHDASASGATLLKTAIMSRRPSPKGEPKEGAVIIMGNGPSLKETLADRRQWLEAHPLLAVNFAAVTPDFHELRPEYYLLADGVFFQTSAQGNVAKLWENLHAVSWPMTLFLPVNMRGKDAISRLPECITLKYYNLTPAEGWECITDRLFRSGLAMPRPRNVLIPAIMMMLREGYREIILTGADHNWSKTLWVTDRNHVVSVQPHFYKDNDEELRRAEELYKNIRIADIYESFAVAFRSYYRIRRYADRHGARIVNATPGSFIDSFDRMP